VPYLSHRDFSTIPPETHQRFMLEVDWDGDGLFNNAYSDVSADIYGEVQAVRGRDYASQLTGRSVAGSLATMLRNRDGKYSSFLATSPLYGKILPGRKVRAWASTPYTEVIWTGFIDSIAPIAASGSGTGEPVASLRASGILKQLGDQSNIVSVAPITSGIVSDAVDDVLDAAGISATARNVETSAIPIAHWYVEQKVALTALQELEETELGFLYEDLNFGVGFDARYHRNVVGQGAVVEFSDDPASNYPYIDLVQADTVRDIYNTLTATVSPYTAAASAILWTLANDTPYIPPGGSVTYKATYADGYVNPWTTPDLGTDIISSGGTLAVSSVVKSAQNMSFTITNSHVSQGSTISLLQARGVAYTAGQQYQVESSDATSQAAYGRRSYPLPSPWLPNAAYAQAAVDYFILNHKDPHPVLDITIPSGANPTGTFVALAEQGATRDLSDRVTVVATGILTKLGINETPDSQHHFIEAIEHRFGPAGFPWMTKYLLSPVPLPVGTNYWIIGDATWGLLDSTSRLAY